MDSEAVVRALATVAGPMPARCTPLGTRAVARGRRLAAVTCACAGAAAGWRSPGSAPPYTALVLDKQPAAAERLFPFSPFDVMEE